LAASDPCRSERIAAIGVSGMVPALVMLDERGEPVRPSIQQNDARSLAQIEGLTEEIDQGLLFRLTGGFTNQQHIAPRLRWVQEYEPENWSRTRWLLGSYDYITALLCGKRTAPPSLELNWAIESGLFAIENRNWLPDLLDGAGIAVEQLPRVHVPTTVVGELDAGVAGRVGLPPGIPVIAGSADHVASALAAGVRDDGDTLIKFGGAGDILLCADRPLTHPKLFIDAHDIPGKYLLNGCMAASGSLVKWYATGILGLEPDKATLRRLDAEAERVPAGADGLVILPYFLGEKTPVMDPAARGVMFGLSLHHGQAHIHRALMEAVIFGFRHHFDVLEEAGHRVGRVIATNGGVSSGLWRSIAASVLGRPVTSFRGHPGSVLGVAFVAGIAGGLFDDWSEIDRFLQENVVDEPEPLENAVYDRGYAIYRDLYRRLQSLFPLILPEENNFPRNHRQFA
jgi:xylulokinase